eukprot:263306-Chlamydomonas_euryale.AAC.1
MAGDGTTTACVLSAAFIAEVGWGTGARGRLGGAEGRECVVGGLHFRDGVGHRRAREAGRDRGERECVVGGLHRRDGVGRPRAREAGKGGAESVWEGTKARLRARANTCDIATTALRS